MTDEIDWLACSEVEAIPGRCGGRPTIKGPKIPEAFKSTPYVMLGNIHPALQLEVLAQVDKPKLVVADTMNFWITGEPKLLGEVMKKVDLLVINDEEARELTGIHNLVKASQDIRKRGPSRVIVKRGEHGALYFDEAGTFFAPDLTFVCRDARGLFALTAICTHAGCSVDFANTAFSCHCHGSAYDFNGNVTRGPAPKSLVHYAMCVTPGGTVGYDVTTTVDAAARYNF